MCENKLANKRILAIMPMFFGYDQEIRKALESQCASVDVIYENIKELNLLFKLMLAYLKPLRHRFIYHYYKKRLAAVDKKYDYVFVIRGSTLTADILSLIREKASEDCRYVMYQWDSAENNASILSIADCFDQVATFDIQDAKKLNWKYRPLFYIEDALLEKESREVDITYVCTVHTQRFEVYKKLKDLCREKGWLLYHHVFIKLSLYIKYKFLDNNPVIREARCNDLSFRSLSISQTYSLYQRSKIVVDYTHPGQTGFTMRTIEALGNGCKLITNNPLIKDADFYDPSNILVYEGTDVEIPEWFVQTPYRKPADEVHKKYALSQWIDDIFDQ